MALNRFQRSGIRAASRVHAALVRLTRGRVGGRQSGLPVVLLTTRGRRSGEARTVPLLGLATERGWAVIGSFGGNDAHPAWFLNLEAEPRAEVEVGGERATVVARMTEGEERGELWNRLAAAFPAYDGYATKTTRPIPVVLLERAG